MGPDFYFPLDLRDAVDVPFLTSSDYTRPQQVEEVIDALGADRVRYIALGSDA